MMNKVRTINYISAAVLGGGDAVHPRSAPVAR